MANDTTITANPRAMLMMAIFVTDEVKDPESAPSILWDMYRETFTAVKLRVYGQFPSFVP
jgi:hypothetical protein